MVVFGRTPVISVPSAADKVFLCLPPNFYLCFRVSVISSGKQPLDAVMLEMGRMVAERIMLIEREELAGPDYYPTHPGLQTWAH